MIRIGMAAAALLALTACEPAAPPSEGNVVEEANVANAMTGGNDSAAVAAMPDAARRLTFMRALTEAGLPCDGVVRAEPVAPQNGLPTWRATCKDDSAYAMTVTPDGTVNILARPAGRR